MYRPPAAPSRGHSQIDDPPSNENPINKSTDFIGKNKFLKFEIALIKKKEEEEKGGRKGKELKKKPMKEGRKEEG